MHPSGRRLSNGGGGGSSSPKKAPKSGGAGRPNLNNKSSSSHNLLDSLDSRKVVLFVAGCVFFTLLADIYFLWPSDDTPPMIMTTPNQPTITKRVTSVQQQQRPKQEIQFANIPPMKKQNRNFTKQEYKMDVSVGREPILRIFQNAGIPPLNDSMIALLPTWDQVVQVVGPHPVVGGLDTCEAFRQNVSAVERMLGAAGMFNTGTNLVTHLLKGNCRIPERVKEYGEDASKEAHGMRWQVPWGKHSPAKYKQLHSTQKAKAINKDWIMPVVTIRHPYTWMHSMCKNGYTSRWRHGRNSCPDLKRDGDWNEVKTKFAEGREEYSKSLAHLWNDWYELYLEEAKYPRVIVRMEDLVFHAQETITQVCECVGGEMRTDRPFTYVIDSAKADSPGHDKSTGFVQAWIKYAKPMPPLGGFSLSDFKDAREALNEGYMEMFHYHHAPATEDEKI